MRNRIAAAALALTSVLSPVYAKAQETYVCDKQQHSQLIQDPIALDRLATALSSSCMTTSRHPNNCVGPLEHDVNKQSMVTAMAVLSEVEYDLVAGKVTLFFEKDGKTAFQSYPSIVASGANLLKDVVSTYCTEQH